MVREDGPRWTEDRFKAALFYAYGAGWIAFLGWTYVVDPGPALRGLPTAPIVCGRGQLGAADSSGQITSTTTGKIPNTAQMKLAESHSST